MPTANPLSWIERCALLAVAAAAGDSSPRKPVSLYALVGVDRKALAGLARKGFAVRASDYYSLTDAGVAAAAVSP